MLSTELSLSPNADHSGLPCQVKRVGCVPGEPFIDTFRSVSVATESKVSLGSAGCYLLVLGFLLSQSIRSLTILMYAINHCDTAVSLISTKDACLVRKGDIHLNTARLMVNL